jgi:hypothetical protein
MAISWTKFGSHDYKAFLLDVDFCVSKMPVLRASNPQWVVFRDNELVHEIPAQHSPAKAQALVPAYLRDQMFRAEGAVELAKGLGDMVTPEVLAEYKAKAEHARRLYQEV